MRPECGQPWEPFVQEIASVQDILTALHCLPGAEIDTAKSASTPVLRRRVHPRTVAASVEPPRKRRKHQ